MGLTSLPTKTDGSLGRAKSALPGSDPSPDLDYYVTATEHEAIKDAIVDLASEVGLHDGSTAGSIREALLSIAAGIEDGDFAGSFPGMLFRTGAGAYEARRYNVTSYQTPFEAGSSGEADGYKAGSLWVQLSSEDDLPAWIWISLGGGGWKRLGSGESDRPGWTGYGASGSTLDLSGTDARDPVAVTAHVPSGGMTITLPDAFGSTGWPMVITKSSGAAGDGITIAPQSGQTVHYATGSHVLAGSTRYVGGSAGDAPPTWIVIAHAGNWVVFGGPIVDVLESTITADADLPDAEIVLVDTSGGPVDVQLPAITTNRARQWTFKLTTTDANGVTFVPDSTEEIEGVNASLLMPGSDTGDLVSCTLYRARSGNWFVL